MNFKKYTKLSLSIILTSILSYWFIFAWINLWTVNNWEQLTESIWNTMIWKINENGQKLEWITNIWWKIGIWEPNPSAKLDVAWPIIRTIAHSTGNWPSDDTDTWMIASRVLTFNKLKTNTDIRISYTDNLRVIGTNKSCSREIKIDWNSCPNQKLIYNFYTTWSNIHRSRTMVGYCSWISSGSHQIQIWVANSQWYSDSDCYTGWLNSTWVIEAEEVN